MRWVLIGILALILLPLLVKLVLFAATLVSGLVYVAVIVGVILFLVGLIRRMIVAR